MVPVLLQKDLPHTLQRNLRLFSPYLALIVPLETMLPFPLLPYKGHSGFGHASLDLVPTLVGTLNNYASKVSRIILTEHILLLYNTFRTF